MSYDRVSLTSLLPCPVRRTYSQRDLETTIDGIRRHGVRPLRVKVVDGSDQYEVCSESFLDYEALTRLPPAHPARSTVPVEIAE